MLGQVRISSENNTILIGEGCTNGASPMTIEIEEQLSGDFTDAANVVYSIVLPLGFTFEGSANDISINYVLASGTASTECALSTKGFTNSNSKFSFTYSCLGTSVEVGKFILSNIIIRCNTVGASGYILRGSSTALTNAIQNGNPYYDEIVGTNPPAQSHPDLRSHGFLTSIVTNTQWLSLYYYNSYPYTYSYGGFQNFYPNSPVFNLCSSLNTKIFAYLNPAAPPGSRLYLMSGTTVVEDTNALNVLIYSMPHTKNTLENYHIEYENTSGCRFRAAGEIDIQHMEAPKPATYNPIKDQYEDTVFAKFQPSVNISSYLQYTGMDASKYSVYSMGGSGVEFVGAAGYNFTPQLAQTGPNTIIYNARVNSNGCQTTFLLHKKLTVYDPSEVPPSWIVITNGKSAPFCENEGDIEFKIVAPPGRYIRYFTMYGLSATRPYVSYFGPYPLLDRTESDVYRANTQELKNSNRVVRITAYFSSQDRTINDQYALGTISVFPKYDIKLLGLPAPYNGDTLALCPSSKDTIIVQFLPENGFLGLSKLKLPSDSIINNNLGISVNGNSYIRKIVPADIFKTIAKSDYNFRLKILYRYPSNANSQLCPDSIVRVIRFFKPVDVSYTRIKPSDSQFCQSDTLEFQINNYNVADKYIWNLGKNSASIIDSNNIFRHVYRDPGKYILNFKTDISALPPYTCNNEIIDTLKIGSTPITSFEVYKNFINTNADFHSTSSIPINIDAPSDTIIKWMWQFDDGTSPITCTDPDTAHRYISTRKTPYAVTHKVEAGWGCVDSITRYVPAFPIKAPGIFAPSIDTFAVADLNGWYHSGDYFPGQTTSSWQNRLPPDSSYFITPPRNQVPTPIIPAKYGVSWITTGNANDSTATYLRNEKSYLESPVFQLDNLSLPMVSLETFQNFDNLFDGAALQYAFCDSVDFGKEKWYTLGNNTSGLNWYNSATILGDPGGPEVYGDNKYFGWTNDTLSNWQTSAYPLQAVKDSMDLRGYKHVRFRVVLGTNNDNTPLLDKTFQGFAFDNFFVGQRNRKVLIEEFVNLNNQDNGSVNTIVNSDPQALNIKYFVGYAGSDAVNDMNRADPSARAYTYGFNKVQRAILDGQVFENEPFSKWGIREYSKQTLKTSDFRIVPSVTQVGGTLQVSATINRNTGSNALVNERFIVHMAVLSNHTTIPNVLRKMLPTAAGTFYNAHDWNAPLTLSHTYQPIQALANVQDFRIVVFIQKHTTHEILQAEAVDYSLANPTTNPLIPVFDPSITQGQVIRAINQEIPLAVIYPHPVARDLQLEFSTPIAVEVRYSVRNSMGVELMRGSFAPGNDLYDISNLELPSGYYTLLLNSENDSETINFIKQ
ncbi:MAG: hypothetical protein MUF42_11545 [Cytophagaceae bacterium]|jgi:hypothetical protein|nr:hypothetical protein [Cytophagaceae bacterium]